MITAHQVRFGSPGETRGPPSLREVAHRVHLSCGLLQFRQLRRITGHDILQGRCRAFDVPPLDRCVLVTLPLLVRVEAAFEYDNISWVDT